MITRSQQKSFSSSSSNLVASTQHTNQTNKSTPTSSGHSKKRKNTIKQTSIYGCQQTEEEEKEEEEDEENKTNKTCAAQQQHKQQRTNLTTTAFASTTHAHLHYCASANNISSDELLCIYAYCTFRSLINASRTSKWWYHVAAKEKSRKLSYVIKADVSLSSIFPSSTSPLLHHITHIKTIGRKYPDYKRLSISVVRLFNLSNCFPTLQMINFAIHQTKRCRSSFPKLQLSAHLHTIAFEFCKKFRRKDVHAIIEQVSNMNLPHLISLSFNFIQIGSYLSDHPTLQPISNVKQLEKLKLKSEHGITSIHPVNIQTIKSLSNLKELILSSHFWRLDLLKQLTCDDCLFRSSIERIGEFYLEDEVNHSDWHEELSTFLQLQSFGTFAQTNHISSLCQLPSLTSLVMADHYLHHPYPPIDSTSFHLLLTTIQTKWKIKHLDLSWMAISDTQLSQLIIGMKQTLEGVMIFCLNDIKSLHCLCQCNKLTNLRLNNRPNLHRDPFIADLWSVVQRCPIKFLEVELLGQNRIDGKDLFDRLLLQLQHRGCDYLQIDDCHYTYDPFKNE